MDMTIAPVCSKTESKELDQLLWEVLWKPLGLPRDIRASFRLNGECIELVAKAEGKVIGGLMANWINDSEAELRHIALKPEVQNQGIGRQLVTSLISIISCQGCLRIHTIARNTSAGFFRNLGFKTAPGIPPEHSDFKKHGITFELMERNVEQANPADGKTRRR